MSKLQISVIYIFYLVLLLEKVLTSYIVISDSEKGFMSLAFLRCREKGGTLLSNKEVSAYADQIKSQCPEVKGVYWIGSYSTMTPIMSLHGCYEYKNFSTGSAFFVSSENSVAKCQARCFSENGIAIKGDICQCFTIPEINSFIQVEAEDCNIKINGEIRGGSENTMSVYIKQGNGDGVIPDCVYGHCEGRRSTISGPCERQDKSRTVCAIEGTIKQFEDTKDWWDATQLCISNNSYLISVDKFVANRDSLCSNDEALRIWTNRRQYMDTIILPGDGIPENYIFNENIVCQSVNMTSFTFVQTRQCNGNQQHGYLCKTESPPSNESSSCIVTIDDEPLKQTSTYRTDLSKSTQTNNLRTTVAGNINVQNTDCKKTSNAGVIVSSTVAVIFALTSVGLFIYIMKRRLAEKESAIRSTYEVVERNRNPEAEMTYDQIITNEET